MTWHVKGSRGEVLVESLCYRDFCSISAQGGLPSKEAHLLLFLSPPFPPSSLPSSRPSLPVDLDCHLHMGPGPPRPAELSQASHMCVGPAPFCF